jgi:light-regulated signal transduction histidine kinase (bacteriophytochrome)
MPQAPTSVLDLSQCDREPVHLPGSIQPHGALLVLDPERLTIECVSENTRDTLGHAAPDLLGQSIVAIPGLRQASPLLEALRQANLEEHNPFSVAFPNGRFFKAIAHRHDGRLLLDLEPDSPDADFQPAYFYHQVRTSIVRLRASAHLLDLCARAVREVRLLTGFDRVLVYRFTPDWAGEVVAEDTADGLPRYLGLRFPASDIPSQARALYAACRLRMIPTSAYTPSALVGRSPARPVDLTHATLRAISPIHLEYMRNMGVTASMGISLMLGDRLWGLITCNHESGERFIPYEARTACGLIGEIVSSLVGSMEETEAADQRVAFLAIQARLLQVVGQERDAARGLTRHTPSLLDVAGASGAALFHQGVLDTVGANPTPAALHSLLAWLESRGGAPFSTDCLPGVYPEAHTFRDLACGLVAQPISFAPGTAVKQRSWLLWFRPEVSRTVAWGGDPTKPVSASPERLHPRKSFALWKEAVHLRSAPFEPGQLAAVRSLAEALPELMLEIEASRQLQETATLLQASNLRLREQMDENQKVELELRRAQKLEAIGRLAAGIAHEINTPLQYVGDSLHFLSGASGELLAALAEHAPRPGSEDDLDYLRSEVPRAIGRSLEGLERVSTIVRAMKSFAHPDGAEKAPADLNQALTSTVEVARSEFKSIADVTLELGPLPKVSCYLGDLNQVFLNLLVNAAHAIQETLGPTRARGQITIRSWHVAPGVAISISDDGGGIPEAIRESIFLPFFTTKEVGRGTGQGLAIARSIVVDRHGGALTFESQVGRGSTFTIRLPEVSGQGGPS